MMLLTGLSLLLSLAVVVQPIPDPEMKIILHLHGNENKAAGAEYGFDWWPSGVGQQLPGPNVRVQPYVRVSMEKPPVDGMIAARLTAIVTAETFSRVLVLVLATPRKLVLIVPLHHWMGENSGITTC